jgi:hypothetical protein
MMNSVTNTWKPAHWALLEIQDLNGDKFVRLLVSIVNKYGGTEGWRLSEPIVKKNKQSRHVTFTDTQNDKYECNYKDEGLNEFLADRYDQVASEQGQLFFRKVTMIDYGETYG